MPFKEAKKICSMENKMRLIKNYIAFWALLHHIASYRIVSNRIESHWIVLYYSVSFFESYRSNESRYVSNRFIRERFTPLMLIETLLKKIKGTLWKHSRYIMLDIYADTDWLMCYEMKGGCWMDQNIMSERCSIAFKSGKCGGQSMVSIPLFCRNCLLNLTTCCHCCAPGATQGPLHQYRVRTFHPDT